MQRRFVSIWFRHLLTNWLALRRPELKGLPFVMAAPDHGRMVITAVSAAAEAEGITAGMAVADARAVISGLKVIDDIPGKAEKLLARLGEWCIRYTPLVAVDLPDGLILDVSGCTHLWGSEQDYLKEIVGRLRSSGYDVRAAMADTVGAAWAVARFGRSMSVIAPGEQATWLAPLPACALRLDSPVTERMQKLGLNQVGNFMHLPRPALRRRFGEGMLLRLAQALGHKDEPLQLLQPPEPYQERLPCLEAISTATGIELAIKQLLETLCIRLQREGMGLRTALLKCYRVDGKMQQANIGTNNPSRHTGHLFKLFELKIPGIEPGLGIELFVLEALRVEELPPEQEMLWAENPGLDDQHLIELLDKLAGKIGLDNITRYLPQEHYWPERAAKPALSVQEQPVTAWRTDKPRPGHLLKYPEQIIVSSPEPDYPPMNFRHRGQVHYIRRSDGPERIEPEWWLENGDLRDYYNLEDEQGRRYWVFRSGRSTDEDSKWYLHGFFA